MGAVVVEVDVDSNEAARSVGTMLLQRSEQAQSAPKPREKAERPRRFATGQENDSPEAAMVVVVQVEVASDEAPCDALCSREHELPVIGAVSQPVIPTQSHPQSRHCRHYPPRRSLVLLHRKACHGSRTVHS